jgi:hypothetical protein
MKEYIVHRGVRPHRHNSIMSFMLSDISWYEMDILYVNNQWYLCHDFECFYKKTNDLFIDFWEIKKIGPKYLLDIKWDIIHNAKDDYKRALNELYAIINGSDAFVWLQFSDAFLYGYGYTLFLEWKKGYIITDPIGIEYFKNLVPDFLMLNVNSVREHDVSIIRDLYPDIYLIGYKCNAKYRIIKLLDAIVCDVWLLSKEKIN